MQFLAIINFTAAIQGLFLAYLLVNRTPSQENRTLSLLVGVMSLAILGPALGLSGYYREFPHLIRIGDPLSLLFGPLLYLYIHLLTKGCLPRQFGWHMAPFGIYLLSLIPFYSLPAGEKIAFGERVLLAQRLSPGLLVIQTFRILHVSAYIVLSLLLLRRFKQWVKANYSDIDRINLDKATYLLRFYLVFMGIAIGIFGGSFFKPINFVLLNSLISLGVSVIIYALAYTTWNRPSAVVIPRMEIPRMESPAEEKPRSTYNLTESQYASLTERLEQLLQKDRIYLESELSLTQLSERLGIPPYQASELINRRYQEPFFDLINRHRIEEIQQRFANPAFSHYSILGIAMDCGFNSKSSFNTAFKKFTGLTPSQVREK